jgi:NAD(P)-dependent dehydrogenase (short-subunit alcohol dehydrogenase family)
MALLDGKHALITGGGSGIGAAIARTLAQAGAAVSIAGRRVGPLDELAAQIPRAKAIVADVTSEADCDAMVATARAAHGSIDILIANAGASESAPIGKVDLAHWQRMLDVNLTGTFLTVRAALADIVGGPAIGAPDRRIILISSTAGLKGYPYVAAYCAAKHGVIGLARALASELRQSGVTVNAVCPGFTRTPLLDASIANIANKTGRTWREARDDLAAFNPQDRFIEPEEIAQTVLWLCTPAARSITGQAISVSGGET